MRRDLPALDIAGRRVDGVVDTVGAGDTFTGVLAAAIARGVDIELAVPRANAAAALSVTGRGAIGGMPCAAQVDSLLAHD
jgi:ribokinase